MGVLPDNMESSPVGKRIVSGSNDCTWQIWDVETGKQLMMHVNRQHWATMNADGHWFRMHPKFDGGYNATETNILGETRDVILPPDHFGPVEIVEEADA